MGIKEVELNFEVLKRLQKIAVALHNLDVASCNYGLSERQEKREEKLEKEVEVLAQTLGLHAYHQSDPRGWPLYLVEDLTNVANTYDEGLGIYGGNK
jgi:hypothetical protein